VLPWGRCWVLWYFGFMVLWWAGSVGGLLGVHFECFSRNKTDWENTLLVCSMGGGSSHLYNVNFYM
jgi:hypothetical protein